MGAGALKATYGEIKPQDAQACGPNRAGDPARDGYSMDGWDATSCTEQHVMHAQRPQADMHHTVRGDGRWGKQICSLEPTPGPLCHPIQGKNVCRCMAACSPTCLQAGHLVPGQLDEEVQGGGVAVEQGAGAVGVQELVGAQVAAGGGARVKGLGPRGYRNG